MYHLVPAGLWFDEAAALETFQRVARIRLGRFDIVGSDVLRESAALFSVLIRQLNRIQYWLAGDINAQFANSL
ncbi:hypothetical protein [Roseovarius amoyensis]|uniref:hypothetical protein n=1 Tax=Roseovarius amoyensis TaxID=2211448 RepID=UPI0013A6DCCF|nr:hypothetical protein [Roseovarius amoyensis]